MVDLIVVELQRAHPIPVLRVVSDFVHNGQARDVQSVMVDGKWLMKDGAMLTMDEPAILNEEQRVANAAWAKTFRTRFAPPAGFSPPPCREQRSERHALIRDGGPELRVKSLPVDDVDLDRQVAV